MLVEIDPNTCRKHLQHVQGKPVVIFILCDKAMYGTVKAAFLSYKKLTGHLGGIGIYYYEPI